MYFRQLNIGNKCRRNYKASNSLKKQVGNSEVVLEITIEKYEIERNRQILFIYH